MASYETKVILTMIANQVALAKSTKQAFEFVRTMANVEDDMLISTYEETRAKLLGNEMPTAN